MSKEPFEKELELEELEQDMGIKFEKMEPAPLRAEFQDELRNKLANKLKEKEAQGDSAGESFPKQQKDGFSQGKTYTLLAKIKRLFKQKNSGGLRNWKTLTSIGLVIILLAGVFWGMGEFGLNTKPVQASEVTIKALNLDKLGIEADTAFLLTSTEPLAEKAVKEALKTNPEFAYSLDKQAGGLEYKIVPQENLAPNTIYTLTFDPEGVGKENLSWAFQTKTEFRVINSLPRDESTHVPVETGIEITFSHENYDLNKLKDYFSISPQVEGTFEKHKKTLVYVPKALQPATIYTVTLKKGLALSGSTEILKEDYVFSFETGPLEQEKPVFNFEMDTGLTEFSTAETPAFSVYAFDDFSLGQGKTPPPLHIDLYRYPGQQEFQTSLAERDQIPRWSYFTWNEYREKLNPQYKVEEYNTQLLKVNDYSHYIVFPKELEAGYYAAEFKAGETIRQIWFQVSDLAAYLAQGEENSLFWVNDLISKAPAPDPQVLIASKQLSVKGDKTGTVFLQEKLMGTERDYALVQSGNKEILVPLEAWPSWYAKNRVDPSSYWKYLYLDRELYQPGDAVNFWGVLAPRGKSETPVQEVTLELMGNYGPYYEGAEVSPILSQKIAVKDKTYSGQMKLPILNPGYYYLQIKTGDTVLLSRGFSVETYQKPPYELSLKQDKKAIFSGETLNFQAKATFFEGTPVPGVELNYYIQEKKGKVTTNEQGDAQISLLGTIQEEDYAPYRYEFLGVNATLPEAGEIYTSGELYVFKSKVYLTGEASRQADNYTLTAKLATVDLTGINNGLSMAEENFLKEPVANSPIKASLYQEVWTKVESGQRYDFINKQVVKTYYHNYSTKHLEDFQLLTDGKGTVTHTGKLDPDNSYYLELSAVDNEGRQFKRRIYIGGSRYSSPDYQYYFLQGKPNLEEGYKPEENVQVTFMVNDQELVPSAKSILFFRGQRVIDTYQVSDNPKYSFTFATEQIPNVNVFGVYFDGYSYREAYSLSIPFAQDSKALEVKIQTDQAEYRPGDKVKLELQVTDVNNKPVQGAQVNLNLVDEALFSLRDQNVNLLSSLYGDHLNLFLLTRKSHNHPEFGGGAEQGGEGGSERKDFRDTVLFTTLTTDREGNAGVDFQLPDNLTSWRVTYHGFTEDLQAVSGTSKIPVRLPFFCQMTLNKTYLEGDSPLVILRSFGEKLAKKQAVVYKIKLINPQGQEKSWSENGTAFTPLDLKLPALETGKYSLTVSATSGSLKDTLTKEFLVARSLQERTVTTQELLQEDLKIEGSPVEPTTVIFSDYEKSQYLRGLYQLAWTNGSRLEQKLAGLEARKLLSEYFPGENIFGEREEQESLLFYQQADGGISILPYGKSELALSAMVASGTSGIFDDSGLIRYFYRVLEGNSAEDDKSLALLGLAALKEPVLLRINDYLLAEKPEPGVQINLALALLEIGDGAYAQEVFRELLGLYGEDLGSVIRINVGSAQDEIIEATTQMALLASRLDQPEKNKLYQYLLENPGQDILNLVEQIQILKYNLKYLPTSPVSFSYELNGEQFTKVLKNKEIFKLTLLPEDLRKIKISQVEGKVGIISEYSLPIQAGETGDGEGLEISRTYLVKESKTTTVQRSDLVQVVINYHIGEKAPAGLYELVDVLPAGLAHISRPYAYHREPFPQGGYLWSYPTEVNGQRLVFQVAKGEHQINYLARVISPGEFTCEAPLLSNIKNKAIYTSGSKDRIVIK
jgi:hypothetical protein